MKKLLFLLIWISSFVHLSATELKIATWNIEWLSAENANSKVTRTNADYDKISEYARKLDADVIALQEVEGKNAASRVFDSNIYNFYFSERNTNQKVGFAVKKEISVKKVDYTDLSLNGTVRNGVDIIITTKKNRKLRLLAVHLKSFCFEKNYTNACTKNQNSACCKLSKQVPFLEEWIDERSSENLPFIVLGDFNRRLSANEIMWNELDDGVPINSDLTGVNLNRNGFTSQCNNSKYPKYIDHILLDKRATKFYNNSFEQLIYKQEDMKYKISDHCPISIKIEI